MIASLQETSVYGWENVRVVGMSLFLTEIELPTLELMNAN